MIPIYEKRIKMVKKLMALKIMILASSFFLVGCGQATILEETESIRIVATFYPMVEFTKAVVGEIGEVELLIPAGTEPHDYEPSAKDVAKIHDADAVVYNSQVFETWMNDIKSNLDVTQTNVIEASEGIELLAIEETDHPEASDEDGHLHSQDPHVWLDPILAIEQVRQIQSSLSEQFPEHASLFKEQSESYIKELEALDQAYQTATAQAKNRTFVTQHGAFSYLAKRYNLTQVAITGIASEGEPTPSRLATLKTFIQDNAINVIYFEENTSGKVAQTLAKETGVKLSVLATIESLTKEQQANGESYLSMMKENLEALTLSIQ